MTVVLILILSYYQQNLNIVHEVPTLANLKFENTNVVPMNSVFNLHLSVTGTVCLIT